MCHTHCFIIFRVSYIIADITAPASLPSNETKYFKLWLDKFEQTNTETKERTLADRHRSQGWWRMCRKGQGPRDQDVASAKQEDLLLCRQPDWGCGEVTYNQKYLIRISLFTLFLRLGQAENNCKQMCFSWSLLSIFGFNVKTHFKHLEYLTLTASQHNSFCSHNNFLLGIGVLRKAWVWLPAIATITSISKILWEGNFISLSNLPSQVTHTQNIETIST